MMITKKAIFATAIVAGVSYALGYNSACRTCKSYLMEAIIKNWNTEETSKDEEAV